jgi:hypothetical protein
MSTELKPITPIDAIRKELPTLTRLMQMNYDGADIAAILNQEIEYLRSHALTTPSILEVHPATAVLAMKDMIKNNLSLDPSMNLVYPKTRQVKIGKNEQGKDIKVKALVLQPTANGELSKARQYGRILDHENPVVSYNEDGRVTGVKFSVLKPSTPEPRWEEFTYGEYDFERWRRKSNEDNGRWEQNYNAKTDPEMKFANDLYTSWRGGIDPEMARAKAIRHSLKKLGTNPYEGRIKPGLVRSKLVDLDPAKDEYTEDTTYQDLTSEQSAAPNEPAAQSSPVAEPTTPLHANNSFTNEISSNDL